MCQTFQRPSDGWTHYADLFWVHGPRKIGDYKSCTCKYTSRQSKYTICWVALSQTFKLQIHRSQQWFIKIIAEAPTSFMWCDIDRTMMVTGRAGNTVTAGLSLLIKCMSQPRSSDIVCVRRPFPLMASDRPKGFQRRTQWTTAALSLLPHQSYCNWSSVDTAPGRSLLLPSAPRAARCLCRG